MVSLPSHPRSSRQAKRLFGHSAGPRSTEMAWRDRSRDREAKFAVDSLLEEAVLSELVSETKFPASWENTGNFVRRGLRLPLLAWNLGPNTMAYDPIPYAMEQGIYFGLAGN